MGFRVWGLGFGVWGLGCGVWGLGFGVWGLGFRAQGLRGYRRHARVTGDTDIGFGSCVRQPSAFAVAAS